jgi:Ca2+-binding RTX toxin-like protein
VTGKESEGVEGETPPREARRACMRKMGLLLAALAVTTLVLGGVALAQARGVIECDPGEPVCFGTPGNDKIRGTAGADEIRAKRGADQVNARGGDDLVLGQLGNDVPGGDPARRLEGGPGDDTVRGGDGQDAVTDYAGDDADELFGGLGADFVNGVDGDPNDRLDCGPAVDFFDADPEGHGPRQLRDSLLGAASTARGGGWGRGMPYPSCPLFARARGRSGFSEFRPEGFFEVGA